MTETISVAEYNALLRVKKPETAAKPQQESFLVRRFNAVLLPYGWRCGECRRPCSDAHSRENTGSTVARSNCLVMWRTDTVFCAERVRFVGWRWDVEWLCEVKVCSAGQAWLWRYCILGFAGWSDEMVSALVSEVSA